MLGAIPAIPVLEAVEAVMVVVSDRHSILGGRGRSVLKEEERGRWRERELAVHQYHGNDRQGR